MTRHFFAALLILLILAPTILGEQYQVAPELIDTVDLTEHRRTFGAPDGAFFILKKSGIELRQYPEIKSRPLNSRGNQKLIASARGKYYAFLGYANFSPTDLKIQTITLFNAAGDQVWTVKDPGCTSFILCDGTSTAVGVAGAEGLAESRLLFYGDTGELRGSTRVENFYAGQWCPGGQWFFAITGNGQLAKFSPAGVESAKIGPASKYFTSRDGSCVAALTDTLLVFALPNVAFAMPIKPELLREVQFAADGSKAAILTRDQLEILDLATKTTLGKLSVENTPFQLFHFDSDPNFNFFVCGANNSADLPDRRNTIGKVLLLNAAATPLWEKAFGYEDWSVRFPDVRIAAESRVFSVLTMNDLYVYRY